MKMEHFHGRKKKDIGFSFLGFGLLEEREENEGEKEERKIRGARCNSAIVRGIGGDEGEKVIYYLIYIDVS